MLYQENKSHQKIAKLFLQKSVIFNMITDDILVEKRGTLERTRRHISKSLLNLDCQVSIPFDIFRVA